MPEENGKRADTVLNPRNKNVTKIPTKKPIKLKKTKRTKILIT